MYTLDYLILHKIFTLLQTVLFMDGIQEHMAKPFPHPGRSSRDHSEWNHVVSQASRH